MENFDLKLIELKKAGKIDKFGIYVEILEICFQQRNREIFPYFDKFMKAWREYLEFDDTPDNNLRKHLGKALNFLFLYIKRTNDIEDVNK